MCLAELGAKDTYLGETSEEINVEAGGSELSLHSCSIIFACQLKMMSSARSRMDISNSSAEEGRLKVYVGVRPAPFLRFPPSHSFS